MNNLQLFENSAFGQVRVIDRDGEPWFVGADVCAALDITNHRDALSSLDDDEKDGVGIADAIGREQITTIINEPGLYSLVLRSRKPEAKAFKRWICHEIIPAVRKHGGYLTPAKIEEALIDPDTLIRLATTLKEERTKRKNLEAQAEVDLPKVIFADSVASSRTSILVGELATLLRQNGINIGQNRLFDRLREDGWLVKNGERKNLPTQKAVDAGYLRIKESTVNNPDGSVRITRTTKVTGRGQVFFINRFLEENTGSLFVRPARSGVQDAERK